MSNKLVAQIIVFLGCMNIFALMWYMLVVPEMSDRSGIAMFVMTAFIIMVAGAVANERKK